MKQKRLLSSGLSGVAGEYLVAGELTRKGYITSITLRNTRGIDILVSNTDASKSVGIQVKTNQDHDKYWILNKKAEDYYADHLFYVFVNLNNGGIPKFFVVPSKIVARFAKKCHADYLKTPGRKGRKHKDSPMRKFMDKKREFVDRWDLLGL